MYETNKGVRVNTPLSEGERQLFQSMRREMESFCLERCMDTLTEHDDEQLEGILGDLRRACARGDIAAIADTDLALHRYIVRRSSCELEAVWQGITSRLLMDYSRIERFDEVVREHEAIVNAVRTRDLDAAKKALSRNII